MDQLQRKYDALAPDFAERSYANLAFDMRHRFDLVTHWGRHLEPGDSLIEVGCGDGYLGQLLAGGGYAYCGVDFSLGMARAAKRRLSRADVEAQLVVGDAGRLPLNGSWDAVVSFMGTFFTYVDDPTRVLAELRPQVRKKVLVDVDPRRVAIGQAVAALRAAGYHEVRWRPLLIPKDRRLPAPALRLLGQVETLPLVRTAPLRWKFNCLVCAEP